MRRRFFYGWLAATLLLASIAHAQQLPKSVAIGSNPPGSLFYALGSGLAKVISEASPIQAQIQPYAGTSTFVPLFSTGELDLGVVNAVDMGMVYRVAVEGGTAEIDLTFTSIGCPAMDMILDDVRDAVAAIPGIDRVELEVVWSPPWTKDRLTTKGRTLLSAYGLAL